MKRVLGILLAFAVMVGMSMPTFAQGKKDDAKKTDGKTEAKKGAPAATKKDGKEAAAKKEAKKGEKKAAAKKSDKKDDTTPKKD